MIFVPDSSLVSKAVRGTKCPCERSSQGFIECAQTSAPTKTPEGCWEFVAVLGGRNREKKPHLGSSSTLLLRRNSVFLHCWCSSCGYRGPEVGGFIHEGRPGNENHVILWQMGGKQRRELLWGGGSRPVSQLPAPSWAPQAADRALQGSPRDIQNVQLRGRRCFSEFTPMCENIVRWG